MSIIKSWNDWNAIYKSQSSSCLIKSIWKKEIVKNLPNSTRGTLLEYLIAYCLNSQGILPFYLQAKINLVDGVIYDAVLFNEKLSPIVLSIKTSLRERYKQAFLEARVLKDVYSSSKSYLLTLSGSEYKTRKKENEQDDGSILDDVIAVDSEGFDKVLEKLKSLEFRKTSKQRIITQGKLFE